jgi:D-alanyl-D-alanine carboxypeptidase
VSYIIANDAQGIPKTTIEKADIKSSKEAVKTEPNQKAADTKGTVIKDTDTKEKATGMRALYYYEPDREERYASFAKRHPELSEEDVCWMVDCDLDIEPYEDTHELPDPDDIHLLVNKHFFLPDGYAPSDLVSVGSTKLRQEAATAIKEMIGDAAEEGLNIWSQSGYRGYDTQVQVYKRWSAKDGSAAADTYSARAGYSEHQTGLTTDLNTISDEFGRTDEGVWVAENSWKYGFIVRYTDENADITLYIREPWHIRYIGREAAKTMREEQLSSYEEYWVKYVRHTPERE